MTVAELIEKLLKFDLDFDVRFCNTRVRGYKFKGIVKDELYKDVTIILDPWEKRIRLDCKKSNENLIDREMDGEQNKSSIRY